MRGRDETEHTCRVPSALLAVALVLMALQPLMAEPHGAEVGRRREPS